MDGNINADEQFLKYDLRQRRAKLIADCIEDVVEACKVEEYYTWLKNIDDLYSVAKHTFKKKDEVKKEYDKLRSDVVILANKYTNAWLKTNRDPEARGQLDVALRKLFEFVMDKLEEAGVFGTYVEDDGL